MMARSRAASGFFNSFVRFFAIDDSENAGSPERRNDNGPHGENVAMNFSSGRRICTASAFVLALYLLLSSCTSVRLISDYDEPTDKALTALQQSTDDFITKLIEKAPSDDNAFEKHKQFYEDADQQLRRLQFRIASIPKNERTVELVKLVRASILGDGKCSEDGTSLRDLHCLPANATRGPAKTALEASRRNVDQTIGAALALELAKKQGLEQNK